MAQPKIIAYLKPVCGWSNGVRAVLKKYSLEYEDRDIINDSRQYHEMVTKSRQPLSPCVEIDGVMLADVSGDEVEAYLLQKGLAKSSDTETDVPTNQPCADHGTPVNTPTALFRSVFRR
jgi:monothiol glutaredoxin